VRRISAMTAIVRVDLVACFMDSLGTLDPRSRAERIVLRCAPGRWGRSTSLEPVSGHLHRLAVVGASSRDDLHQAKATHSRELRQLLVGGDASGLASACEVFANAPREVLGRSAHFDVQHAVLVFAGRATAARGRRVHLQQR
jgi:hypothetical protein